MLIQLLQCFWRGLQNFQDIFSVVICIWSKSKYFLCVSKPFISLGYFFMVFNNDPNRNSFLGSDSLKTSSDVNVHNFSTVRQLAGSIVKGCCIIVQNWGKVLNNFCLCASAMYDMVIWKGYMNTYNKNLYKDTSVICFKQQMCYFKNLEDNKIAEYLTWAPFKCSHTIYIKTRAKWYVGLF